MRSTNTALFTMTIIESFDDSFVLAISGVSWERPYERIDELDDDKIALWMIGEETFPLYVKHKSLSDYFQGLISLVKLLREEGAIILETNIRFVAMDGDSMVFGGLLVESEGRSVSCVETYCNGKTITQTIVIDSSR